MSTGPGADGAVVAVVVNYNAGPHLVACVRSLRDDGVDEIVVVDNASTDGSTATVEGEPGVRVITLKSNVGMGSAVNRGAESVTSEFVLEINPDTIVEPGMVKALVGAMERDPALGVVGPRIENSDGSVYPSARTFPSLVDAVGHAFLGLMAPSNRFTRRYRMLDTDPDRPRTVDWVSGACMLVRRKTFEQIGGFDPRYFMYLEDVDICWRAWQAGWKVAYEPAGRIMHVQGVSTAQLPYRMLLAHHRSLFTWWNRTTHGPRRLLMPAVIAGLALRLALACGERAWSEARGRHRRPSG